MIDDPAGNLRLRGNIIRGLQQHLIHGGHSLGAIPDDIKLIVEKDMWREWVDPVTGEVHIYASFQEFVRAPFTEGLNAELHTLKNLCRDDVSALAAIDKATKKGRGNPTGNNQYTVDGNVDNVHVSPIDERPSGNTRQRAMRRLRKDRPDLHERVLADEISPHAAMVEAGFRKRTITVPADLDGATDALIKRFGADALYEIVRQKFGRGSEGSRA